MGYLAYAPVHKYTGINCTSNSPSDYGMHEAVTCGTLDAFIQVIQGVLL